MDDEFDVRMSCEDWRDCPEERGIGLAWHMGIRSQEPDVVGVAAEELAARLARPEPLAVDGDRIRDRRRMEHRRIDAVVDDRRPNTGHLGDFVGSLMTHGNRLHLTPRCRPRWRQTNSFDRHIVEDRKPIGNELEERTDLQRSHVPRHQPDLGRPAVLEQGSCEHPFKATDRLGVRRVKPAASGTKLRGSRGERFCQGLRRLEQRAEANVDAKIKQRPPKVDRHRTEPGARELT